MVYNFKRKLPRFIIGQILVTQRVPKGLEGEGLQLAEVYSREAAIYFRGSLLWRYDITTIGNLSADKTLASMSTPTRHRVALHRG
jgi:hypothetical protein